MIKRLIIMLLLSLSFSPLAFASSSANIRFHITGANSDNRYFICVPNVGCLSILAAEHGKGFPFFEDVQMHNIFLTNLENFQVYALGLPPSCNRMVHPGQTLTIYGHLETFGGKSFIQGLSCSLS